MSERALAAGYLDDFRARGEAIADACTRCGECFRACPMVAPAGLAGVGAGDTTAGDIRKHSVAQLAAAAGDGATAAISAFRYLDRQRA